VQSLQSPDLGSILREAGGGCLREIKERNHAASGTRCTTPTRRTLPSGIESAFQRGAQRTEVGLEQLNIVVAGRGNAHERGLRAA
jgi:hypothetical protein